MRNGRVRIKSENGFTLVELMVVTLIIGILAGIGLPAFLGEQSKGQDAGAKSNARNMVSAVEACFSETRAYDGCDTMAELEAADTTPGVELTDTGTKKKGAVSVTATATTFEIAGYSQSSNVFVIAKTADGTFTRTCSTGGNGGCKSSDVW